MNITRKLKIAIVEEDKTIRKERYQFIRDAQYAQYQALNRAMSFRMATYYKHNQDFKSKAYQEEVKSFKYNLSNPVFSGIRFGTGVDSLSAVKKCVDLDFSLALKNGLAKGERSINNYKRSYPLMTRNRNLHFTYDEETNSYYIRWVNHIVFQVVLGRKDKNYLELVSTLNKIIAGQSLSRVKGEQNDSTEYAYKIGDSKIMFDKKGYLILLLSINIPNKTIDSIPGRVLGVDIGIANPAYGALNDCSYIRKSFGDGEEIQKHRTQFRKRYKRTQQQLENAPGGKGRTDKLSALEHLSHLEKKWVQTYNHTISKQIINFAIKNQCESIHLEGLASDGFDDVLLGRWSYFELQEMINYKATLKGIQVFYVDPAYTSQTCSACGHIDKNNRLNQSNFICQKCGFKANADHNAAINIGRRPGYTSKKAIEKFAVNFEDDLSFLND